IQMKERVEMKKGYNEYQISKAQINQAGVYYYQIDYQSNTVTKKMIITE
ncbi:MAG: hypothetical protein JNL65_12580, partial [Saprospiraceae bacterium]|nr:hypothetical protein [Saprospiraceae bacterium]